MERTYKIELEIPEKVTVIVEKSLVKIKGPKGEVQRDFNYPRIEIEKTDKSIILKTKKIIKAVQNDKMIINSYESHINNMFKGALDGYFAKVKVCSGHFPIQAKLEGNVLQVKNFLGEKIPRKAVIPAGVKAEVKGDIVELTGVDKEKVGQAAANIEQSTRITNRDRRIFQDGCYIILKPGEVQK
ncbi:50S ribosomal protein L6 [Candidatus Woesearchaeota archaeon]|nr:50S ribosomal protein L6P [uncultured archaeon]MBS3175144.1 50S ribosomal protein L6 [Candidatus Woesearchaeota archaeon]